MYVGVSWQHWASGGRWTANLMHEGKVGAFPPPFPFVFPFFLCHFFPFFILGGSHGRQQMWLDCSCPGDTFLEIHTRKDGNEG